ncbi:MAG: aminotransferase class IV [Microthrixaceae bacterium]
MKSPLHVFETLELRDGRPFALTRHLERLRAAAAALLIEPFDPSLLLRAVEETCQDWGNASGRLRMSWSGKLTVACSPMTVQREPIAISTCSYRLDPQSATVALKSSAYATPAALLAAYPDSQEVVFGNLRGELCSGAMSNLFIVLDGQLLTPALDSGCRAGVTRELLLEALSSAGRPAVERCISLGEIDLAEEIFVVSTARQIQPAAQMNQRSLSTHRPLTEFAQACFDKNYAFTIDP